MAKYTISIKKSAEKELKKLSAEMYLRVKKGILNLAENPRPNGCKKLKGKESYRIREVNFRIIYEIEDDVLIIMVVKIGHRKEVYD